MAVNLNTATVDELKDIPGLGEERAKQIVNYREKSGPFENWDDLKDVPGFSENLIGVLKKGGVEIA